jgi:ADP-ribosylglycohydrolase
MPDLDDALRGALLGTALGDALGLRYEGLTAATIARLAPDGLHPFGDGVVSDDTEQTWLLLQAHRDAHGDLDHFRRLLGRGLRRWFLALPPGIGLGTARALIKLCLGVPATHSGVHTAGNGAAMRIAPLGVVVLPTDLRDWVEAASRVTHTDPRAIEGALVIARAAHLGAHHGHAGKRAAAAVLLADVADPTLSAALRIALSGSVDDVVEHLGVQGYVTGFVVHTVPVAVALWLAHDDLSATVDAAVRLGGDTDTVAAIAGALCGATSGARAIPPALAQIPALPPGLDVGVPRAPAIGSWRARLRNLRLLVTFVAHLATRRL